jgi:hypothetical protein
MTFSFACVRQEESDDDEEEHRERSLREIAEVEANSHKKMQKRVEEQVRAVNSRDGITR